MCALRGPSYFLVTWNTTAGLDSRTEYHHCPVNDIRIRLPKNVEKCNLVITITAGNSVGMSSPTMFTSKLITIFPSLTNEATVLQVFKGGIYYIVYYLTVSLSRCILFSQVARSASISHPFGILVV